MDGKWEVQELSDVYESEWLKLQVADVELPDKTFIKHDVLTTPIGAGFAMAMANVAEKGTLFIWRHRFITDTWTWELPAGGVEARELPKQAAAREMLEETGWKPGKLEPLISFQPLAGMIDRQAHGFITHEATFEGEGRDRNEAADIAWLSKSEILTLIEKGDLSDGSSLLFVLYAMSKNLLI